MTPTHLQGIALSKCGIQLASNLLVPILTTDTSGLTIGDDEHLTFMLSSLKELCTDLSINCEPNSGPSHYFLKCIAHQWGPAVTQKLCENKSTDWMCPALSSITLVNKVLVNFTQ